MNSVSFFILSTVLIFNHVHCKSTKHHNIRATRLHNNRKSSSDELQKRTSLDGLKRGDAKGSTTNRVQFHIRNRHLHTTIAEDDFAENRSISLESSYSFEPIEWSDNRCPPTLRPIDEHKEYFQKILDGLTSPPTSDPEETLDPDGQHLNPYECLYCGALFDDIDKLKYHYTHRHADKYLVSTTQEPVHECVFCMESFNRSQFRRHQETAHNLTSQKYPWEVTGAMTYEMFNEEYGVKLHEEKFGGEYDYHTWPKNNTFFMTIYDVDSNEPGPWTHHYVDPWPGVIHAN